MEPIPTVLVRPSGVDPRRFLALGSLDPAHEWFTFFIVWVQSWKQETRCVKITV